MAKEIEKEWPGSRAWCSQSQMEMLQEGKSNQLRHIQFPGPVRRGQRIDIGFGHVEIPADMKRSFEDFSLSRVMETKSWSCAFWREWKMKKWQQRK